MKLIILAASFHFLFLVSRPYCAASEWSDAEETIRGWTDRGFGTSDYYYGLLVYPMELNSVREEYLSELPCFGPGGAAKIASYRQTNAIETLLELTNAGLNSADLLAASPFVTVKPSADRGVTVRTGLVYASEEKSFQNPLPDDENAAGIETEFRSTLDVGPARLYFASSMTNVPVPGAPLPWEDMVRRSRYYAMVKTDSVCAVAGHYRLAFGQNLLFGPAFTPPVSGFESRPAKKTDRGLVPGASLSVDADNNGMRDVFDGLAVSADFSGVDILGYRPCPRIVGFVSSYGSGADGFTNQTDYGADFRIALPMENSSVGFTAARQSRADGKFDSAGLSFHYDIPAADVLALYGEAARFNGMAAVQGVDLRAGWFRASLLGFYADTNYNAPNASDILHSHKDAWGYFAGAGVRFHGFESECFMDTQTKLSDPSDVRHRYQVSAVLDWDDPVEWMEVIELSVRSRYSELPDGLNLRTSAGVKGEFFRGRIILDIQWQDLLDFTVREMGNMLSVRLRAAPWELLSAVLRWNGYRSASYRSALFDTPEAAYPGDLSVSPYYGIGNEWTAGLKWKTDGGFGLNAMARWDSRELECGRARETSGLTLFAEFLL